MATRTKKKIGVRRRKPQTKREEGERRTSYEFQPVGRHLGISAPLSHHRLLSEKQLPKGQKAIAFLPHSDDGALFGGALLVMNRKEGRGRKPRNKVRIAVVSPGHHGVEGKRTKAEKTQIRLEEAHKWAEELGFSKGQLEYLDAARTYENLRGVHPIDQRRMDRFIREEEPTMVFVPPIDDTVQHINVNTRKMVMRSLRRWLEEEHRTGRRRDVLVVEYQTNHVPLLPAEARNLNVVYGDTSVPERKHRANRAHVSQERAYLGPRAQLVEALDGLTTGDDTHEIASLGRAHWRDISGVRFHSMSSHAEHFGVTRMRAKMKGGVPIIAEERLVFPRMKDMKEWKHIKRWWMS